MSKEKVYELINDLPIINEKVEKQKKSGGRVAVKQEKKKLTVSQRTRTQKAKTKQT